MKKSLIRFYLTICLVIACIGLVNLNDAEAAAKVSLKESQGIMQVGTSKKLKIKNLGSNVKDVSWSVSDKSVASVSKKGKVKAKKPGTSEIKCVIKYSNSKQITLKYGLVVCGGSKATAKDLYVGTWHTGAVNTPIDWYVGYTVDYTLYADGTGEQVAYGLFRDSVTEQSADSGVLNREKFTWTTTSAGVRMDASGGSSYYFTYSTDDDGSLVGDYFTLKRSENLTGYVRADRIYEYNSAMNLFLGHWYCDFLEFTFNDDGTGSIYCPDCATSDEFTIYFTWDAEYNVNFEPMLYMDIDFGTGEETWAIICNYNNGRTIQLEDSELILSRTFDINNMPLSKKKIGDMLSGLFNPLQFVEDEVTKAANSAAKYYENADKSIDW